MCHVCVYQAEEAVWKKREKRPLLASHSYSVKTVWHHGAVAPEKKGLEEMFLSLPTFLAFRRSCVSFSLLPPPFFSSSFFPLYFPCLFLSWPSGSDPAAYTNRDGYTGENDKNVQREIWMETRKSWNLGDSQAAGAPVCLLLKKKFRKSNHKMWRAHPASPSISRHVKWQHR